MCGGLIKAQSVERYYPEFLRIGYVSLVLTLTLGILITVEYVKLSKLARELPEELAERRRKADLLSRLQADVEEKKESPADAP